MSSFTLYLVSEVLFTWMMVLCADVFVGSLRLLVFSSPAIVGASAYGVAYANTKWGVNGVPEVLLGCAIGVALSSLLALAYRVLPKTQIILVSISAVIVIGSIFSGWETVTGGDSGIPDVAPFMVFGLTIDGAALVVNAMLLVFALGAIIWARRFRHGLRWRAIGEDAVAARVAGVAVGREILVAGFIAGIAGGLAGVGFAGTVGAVSPSSFSLDEAILIIAYVLVGGADSVIGVGLGATVGVLLPELLLRLAPSQNAATNGFIDNLVFGIAMLLVLTFAPEGIAGKQSWLPRVIRRYARLLAAKTSREEAMSPVPAPAGDLSSPLARTGASSSPGSAMGDPEVGRQLASADQSVRAPAGSAVGPNHKGTREKPVLAAENVVVRIGGSLILNQVDLALYPGECVGLLGRNGAGKSTLLDTLTGVRPAVSGSISYTRDGKSSLAVGRTFQGLRVFTALTVAENLRLRAEVVDAARQKALCSEALNLLSLQSVAANRVADLPFAMQKRVGIALAILGMPTVVLLDEPLAGLDIDGVDLVREAVRSLKESGAAVLVVEHNTEALGGMADRIVFMEAGRVVLEGAPEVVLTAPVVLEAYFGSSGTAAGSQPLPGLSRD